MHKEEEEKEHLRLEEEERLCKEAKQLCRQRERDEEEECLRMEEDERRNQEALESLCLEEAVGGVDDAGVEDVVMMVMRWMMRVWRMWERKMRERRRKGCLPPNTSMSLFLFLLLDD